MNFTATMLQGNLFRRNEISRPRGSGDKGIHNIVEHVNATKMYEAPKHKRSTPSFARSARSEQDADKILGKTEGMSR